MDATEATGGFVERADGSVLVDGSTAIEDVMAKFSIEALPEGEQGAYHTMGGFVMARLGRVPKVADVFEWEGLRIEVVDMDGRRIDKVLVAQASPGFSAAPGAGPATPLGASRQPADARSAADARPPAGARPHPADDRRPAAPVHRT
jgi:NhaP-type Na+/H+ and K+/H+ antiporter